MTLKKVLVTGASSGLGKLTVQTLLKHGFSVVASMRGVQGKNQAVANELRLGGAEVVELDVTSDASVFRGVEEAIKLADGLEVVVNNAGLGILGPQEGATPEDWQKIFDVNVFGVQRVNRAVLPYMRNNSSGLLIHISSLLARIVFPYCGPYNASKWALEAMAQNYRIELAKFGVDACIVEPGVYGTSFMENCLPASEMPLGYATTEEVFAGGYSTEEKQEPSSMQDPQLVADTVARLISTPMGKRPFRSIADTSAIVDDLRSYNDEQERITQTYLDLLNV